jgi:CheY-like chemotaxis protein
MSRTVVAAVDDMFFASKIRATAEHLAVDLHVVRSTESALNTARAQKPDLIIVDLQSEKIDPIELAEEIKSDDNLRETRLLGFFSHVLTDWQRRAQDAGYTRVMPRSAFANRLSGILAGDD